MRIKIETRTFVGLAGAGAVSFAAWLTAPLALACDHNAVAPDAQAAAVAPVASPPGSLVAERTDPTARKGRSAVANQPEATPAVAESAAAGVDDPPTASGTLVAQNTGGSTAKKSDAKGVIVGRVVAKPARYQANAVVYLQSVNGKLAPPSKPVHMDQKGMQFEPRVLAVLKGTTVDFLNSDPAEHNIYTPDGEKYDLGKWKQGEKRSYTFGKAGAYTQLCKIHPAMIGYIVVVENPYFGVTSQDGSFQIAGVPPGEHTLLVWHERLKAIATKVTVEAGKPTEVEIPLAR